MQIKGVAMPDPAHVMILAERKEDGDLSPLTLELLGLGRKISEKLGMKLYALIHAETRGAEEKSAVN